MCAKCRCAQINCAKMCEQNMRAKSRVQNLVCRGVVWCVKSVESVQKLCKVCAKSVKSVCKWCLKMCVCKKVCKKKCTWSSFFLCTACTCWPAEWSLPCPRTRSRRSEICKVAFFAKLWSAKVRQAETVQKLAVANHVSLDFALRTDALKFATCKVSFFAKLWGDKVR